MLCHDSNGPMIWARPCKRTSQLDQSTECPNEVWPTYPVSLGLALLESGGFLLSAVNVWRSVFFANNGNEMLARKLTEAQKLLGAILEEGRTLLIGAGWI